MHRILKFLMSLSLFLPAFGNAGVVYRDANVRISVISEGAVRLEYAPDGNFIDAPTLLAVGRDYPDIQVSTQERGGFFILTTRDMELRYRKNSGDFTPKNLSVKSLRHDVSFTWRPGDRQKANLKGTYRTLDGYDGETSVYDNGSKMPIEDGLLARDGWTLVDDSRGLRFDNSEWPWVTDTASTDGARDWYLLVYGHDYRQALNDFTKFAGKVPLPPRFAFGYWWSRYWCYTDNELRRLVSDFKSHSIPLDVLVIDMDWHYTEEGKGGWTGYTWNRSLFPDPKGILKFIGDNDLKITMNLHPAGGVHAYEEQYPEMCRLMGLDPAGGKTIEYEGSSKLHMKSWLDAILHPMQADGVSFWWLDWQQQQKDNRFTTLDNVWWLNYVFFSDMERNYPQRPMLYHRWGGLGNHRYQIGFSGDASITWNSLDFQPYFNSTASNVLYGFWSHDIGGHHMGIERIEPEMFVRWMQFGQYSPILRTHSTKNENLRKEPWSFDNEHYRILKSIIEHRYAMSPYNYTYARVAHDTGVSMCRPMYYDYPEAPEAYDPALRNEYMFGDQMLVMPVTRPMGNGEFYSESTIWLPDGNNWYELSTGTMLRGGQTVTRRYAIDEMPVFVKAGSIVPMAPGQKNLRSNDLAYELNIYPGGDGRFEIYEDNGNDKAYRTDFARTCVASRFDGSTLTVDIAPRIGKYEDMPAERTYSVRVNGYVPPARVLVDGIETECEYDGDSMSLLVDLPDVSAETPRQIVVSYSGDPYAPDGMVGKLHRIGKAIAAVKDHRAGLLFRERLSMLESAGRAISYSPDRFGEIVGRFDRDYAALPEILQEHGFDSSQRDLFLRYINYQQNK